MASRLKIKLNRIKCKLCSDIITSYNRHDFKWCKCGEVAVDGGLDYLRRCGIPANCEELSEYEDEADDKSIED